MVKKLFLLSAFLISGPSFADEWSAPTTVNEINAGYSDGNVIFSTTTSETHNPAGCIKALYEADPSGANVDYILSLLLSAQARGASVRIAVHPTKCGRSNYPMVTRLRIMSQ